MKAVYFTISVILISTLFSCSEQPENIQNDVSEQIEINLEETPKSSETMNSYVSIVEVPANDIDRAISFYSNVLDLEIEKMAFEGMEMGILPYENQMVTLLIAKGEGFVPSSSGTTVYLDAGEDLQPTLNKVEKNGGKIIIPKTPHADESGFFAIFTDSEGNNMGLNSLR